MQWCAFRPVLATPWGQISNFNFDDWKIEI